MMFTVVVRLVVFLSIGHGVVRRVEHLNYAQVLCLGEVLRCSRGDLGKIRLTSTVACMVIQWAKPAE